MAVVSKVPKVEMPSLTREIYGACVTLCNTYATNSPGQRSMHNHLSDLRMLGILLAQENWRASCGNYYSYEFDIPFSSAVDAMSDVLHLENEIETIRDNASMSNI